MSHDSQDDSQFAGQLRTTSDAHGICDLVIELQWTLMDTYGRKARGLQNRVGSSIEVRSSSRLCADVRPVGQ